MANHDEQLDKLNSDVRELMVQVREYVTVTRRHIAEEEAGRRRIESLGRDHEERLREIEDWKTRREATMPTKWLDTDQVEKRLLVMENVLKLIQLQMAKWAGVVAVLMIIGDIVIKPLVTKILPAFFGG